MVNESINDMKEFSSNQKYGFLDELLGSGKSFSKEDLDRIDNAYQFTSSTNAEIEFRWFKLGLKNDYSKILEPTIHFITSQGRMKYTRPLYRELHNSTIGQDIAIPTFLNNRNFYHKIAAKMIAQDLGLS